MLLADYYWNLDVWEGCTTECSRFLFNHTEDEMAFYALYRGGMAHRSAGAAHRAISWLRRSVVGAPEELKDIARFQLALTYWEADQPDISELEFYRLSVSAGDSALRLNSALLQGVVAIRQGHWEEAREALARARPLWNRSSAAESSPVDSLLLRLASRKDIRNPGTAKLLSTILPGAGHVYMGDYLGGLASLAYFGFATLALSSVVRHGTLLESSILFSSFWLRSYLGARDTAERHARDHNACKESVLMDEILATIITWSRGASSLEMDFSYEEALAAVRKGS